MKQTATIKLKADIEVINGLAIGGGKEDIEIGGIDNQVIKNPRTGAPYIPGSSVKGKLRFLTEWRLGKVTDGKVCNCGAPDCDVCRIFGTLDMDHGKGPTRLLVRDAHLQGPFEPERTIEIKYGTAINRLTGTVQNGTLRNMERVVAGTRFDFELVFRVFDTGDGGTNDVRRFGIVAKALQWLEDDTLGGSGSRGCGKIAFRNIRLSGLKEGAYANTTELIAAVAA